MRGFRYTTSGWTPVTYFCHYLAIVTRVCDLASFDWPKAGESRDCSRGFLLRPRLHRVQENTVSDIRSTDIVLSDYREPRGTAVHSSTRLRPDIAGILALDDAGHRSASLSLYPERLRVPAAGIQPASPAGADSGTRTRIHLT